MITIGKKVLSLVLLALIAAVPLACGHRDRQPDNRTEVNVGGDRGVTVEHR
jgi:hypothetical protein